MLQRFFLFAILSALLTSCTEREVFDPGYTAASLKALYRADSVFIERYTPSGMFAKAGHVHTDVHVINCRILHEPGFNSELAMSGIAQLLFANYQYTESDSAQDIIVYLSDSSSQNKRVFPVKEIIASNRFLELSRGYYQRLVYGENEQLMNAVDTTYFPAAVNQFVLNALDSLKTNLGAGGLLFMGFRKMPMETRAGKVQALVVSTRTRFGEEDWSLDWIYRDGRRDERMIGMTIVRLQKK